MIDMLIENAKLKMNNLLLQSRLMQAEYEALVSDLAKLEAQKAESTTVAESTTGAA